MARDIPREEIAEALEIALLHERDSGNLFLENAKVELIREGIVEIKLDNGNLYEVRVIHKGVGRGRGAR